MARRHALAMESYDRLFPNQDTLPRGGFGSLIALPLQLEARNRGNTVFLDQDLAPFADQWAWLASVERVTPEHMEQIAEDAAREGRILGVRMPQIDDVEDPAPWTRRPSGRPQRLPLGEPLPQQIRAILAQRLFVEKAGIPSSLLNRIKRLAAFQNPEFYKRQGLRLFTALTPRVIACAEEHSHHVSLPRGCEDDLRALLSEHGVPLELEDEREGGEKIALEFRGELTAPQKEAAQAILRHDIGLFVAPPGAGKTVVGTYLVAARGCSTLVLVHRKPLLDQWVAQLSLFLGLPAARVGRTGGSRPKGDVDVAMLQSLVRKESVADLVATYGHVIVDECHHVPAVSFERVLNEVQARFITGLTATPYRRDGQHPILHMQCGPVRSSIDAHGRGGDRPFERRLLARGTRFDSPAEDGIQKLYAELASDQARNALILSDVRTALEEGRSPIVLTERRDHLERLADGLRAATPHVVVLRGGGTAKRRRETADQIDAIGEAPGRVLLATGRYAGEGFDDARLDTLFLALPVSWKGTLVQYAGRLHRLHQGKKEVRVYDYVDARVPLLRRMFERRLRGYRAIGYDLVETVDQALGAL
jgi:superfamily II DNA or RNA helicase